MNKFFISYSFWFYFGEQPRLRGSTKCHRLRFIIGNVTHHGRDWFGVRQLG